MTLTNPSDSTPATRGTELVAFGGPAEIHLHKAGEYAPTTLVMLFTDPAEFDHIRQALTVPDWPSDPECRIVDHWADHRCHNRDGQPLRDGQACYPTARRQALS